MDLPAVFQSIRPRYPELAGQVALVTGASKGIGWGIPLRLGREGMKVVLNSRNAEEVQRAASGLAELGVETLAVAADMGKTTDVQRLLDETLQRFGTLDLLVNNAANLRRVLFFDVTEAMFDDEFAANVKGPWLASMRAAQVMRQTGHGCIIHISSVGGLRAHYRGLPYDATKGALDAMTRVMGIELAQYGIRVNGIAPGATWTERRPALDDARIQEFVRRIPALRMGLPFDIGGAVAFLASPDADYIIGQTLYVDGGITAQLSPSQYQI